MRTFHSPRLQNALVGGMPVALFKACIGEDDHEISQIVNQLLKTAAIVDSGCIAISGDNES